MGTKMKGAKVLGKYAAPRLKRSGAQPSDSQSADFSGSLSFKSALSHSSILSFVSIGSAGSILSIGSAGSILSIGKAAAAPGRGYVGPEAEMLLEEEEILPETNILTEEMPPGEP